MEAEIKEMLHQISIATAIRAKRMLTNEEAAMYLGISEATLKAKTLNHEIGYYKPAGVNGAKYYDKEELERYMMQPDKKIKSLAEALTQLNQEWQDKL